MMPYLFILLLWCLSGVAQAGDVAPFKECATLINMTDQEVMGVMRTAPYKFQGRVDRHEGNFRLQPDDTVVVCSTGPFYDGYKVELTIRTIMPLFTCKTRLTGDIPLRKKPSESGIDILYAECK